MRAISTINLFTLRAAERAARPEKPRPTTWAERFEVFHGEHPEVYRAFCEIVDQLWARGHRRFGSQGVFWLIRAEHGVEREGRTFALPNDYSPHYARLYMREHPERDGFFETRELKV